MTSRIDKIYKKADKYRKINETMDWLVKTKKGLQIEANTLPDEAQTQATQLNILAELIDNIQSGLADCKASIKKGKESTIDQCPFLALFGEALQKIEKVDIDIRNGVVSTSANGTQRIERYKNQYRVVSENSLLIAFDRKYGD